MAQDHKYGQVTLEHGDHIPADEPVIVFRARDVLTPQLLAYYHMLCMNAGSPMRHLRLVAEAHQRFLAWQAEHAGDIKVPDSETSREWMPS